MIRVSTTDVKEAGLFLPQTQTQNASTGTSTRNTHSAHKIRQAQHQDQWGGEGKKCECGRGRWRRVCPCLKDVLAHEVIHMSPRGSESRGGLLGFASWAAPLAPPEPQYFRVLSRPSQHHPSRPHRSARHCAPAASAHRQSDASWHSHAWPSTPVQSHSCRRGGMRECSPTSLNQCTVPRADEFAVACAVPRLQHATLASVVAWPPPLPPASPSTHDSAHRPPPPHGHKPFLASRAPLEGKDCMWALTSLLT